MALKFRRGTTAQQSGSLAFGEPYVNTTLGTLVVGGTSGDIVLSTSGTGSTGTFGAISGSGLDITGNANVAGNVTIGGQLTIGDQTSDTVNVVAALSSSLIPQTTNAFDLGSASKIWRDLYISTGSIKFVDGTTVVGIFDLNSYNSLKSSTGSANVSIANLNSETASLETRMSTLATLTGSNSIKLTNLESTTASLNTSVSNINTFTGSQLTQNTSLATISGSLISSASNLTQRVAANEAVSSSYARTNSSNTFNGTQTVSGSLYVTQDLVVQGSSSIQNISSSNVIIGAAYVTLNTNSPTSRYAGFNFIDSGSGAGRSGSFFYDSVDDEMIFVHKGNGTNVTSSHVVMGPETYDNLGNETYMTTNRIPKVLNFEHIGDSNITDTGTEISLNSLTSVTGSLKVSGGITGSLSGYATAVYTPSGTANQFLYQSAGGAGSTTTSTGNVTYDSANTSLNVANIAVASTGTLASSLDRTNNISMHDGAVGKITIRNNSVDSITIFRGGAITLSGSVTATTGFTGSLSGNASTATTLATARTINGTSFNGSADITIQNLVSGSSQIAIASTTGFGTYINQAVLTTSSPTFAGLTISGSIASTGDIVAYSTSDKRFKSNIQLIPNALEKVSKLNGVTWTWNEDVNEITKTTPNTGLIAQEVQEVLPEVVMEREDGHLGLDYSKMMGLLVEAIKEQQQQIHSLTIEIEELKKAKGL